MKENLNNQNIQGTGNRIAEDLRQIKLDRQQIDRRDKQIRFRCDHKDSHGRAALQQDDMGNLVCRICGTKINAKLQNAVEVNRKLQDVINIVECIKLAATPELTPSLAKIEEGIDSLLPLYERIILKGGNKKSKKSNDGGNQRRAAYGQSKL